MNSEKGSVPSEGQQIDIEPGTSLQVEIEGISFRFRSVFIGLETNEYLIVKVPLVPREASIGNIRSKLFSGVQIVVRYLHDGRVIGFRSQLIEAIFSPQRLMFIKYPKSIERHDLRSKKRVACTLPVIMTVKNKEVKGTMSDISEKGCQYLTRALKDMKSLSINKEDLVSLKCQFPGVSDEQVISGRIKNINKASQEWAIGVQFQQMSTGVTAIIGQYISTIEEFF